MKKIIWFVVLTVLVGLSFVQVNTIAPEPEDDQETIVFTLETPLNISIGDIEETSIIVNISSNETRIRNETILFARTASWNNTPQNSTFMLPALDVAPNGVRGHGRNLDYWFEKFNASGTGELSTLGKWACGALPNSSKFTVLDWGSNWTRVQVQPCSCSLFPKFWFLDRKKMIHEDKTDQYVPIYENNKLKTEFNLTNVPTDTQYWSNDWRNATWHIFFNANATSGTEPIRVYYANNSYTTGPAASSPYTAFLGSIDVGETYTYSISNSNYYAISFNSNNARIGTVNLTNNYYFIFVSDAEYDDAWKLYYANDSTTINDRTFDFENTYVAEVSTTNGTTWYELGNDTTDNEVLFLKFDEGAGDNLVDSAYSYTGCYHNGTRHGATWNASGHEGSCLDFDDNSEYVNVTDDEDYLNFTDEISVSCWVNPANLRPYDYWISKEDAFRFGTGSTKNKIRFGFYRGLWRQESTADNYLFDGDIWYHVAATLNLSEPETLILYLNGTEVHRQSGFVGSGYMEYGTGNVYIGTRYGLTDGFIGSIDDVQLWQRALSPDEVYDIYSNITRKGTPDVNFNVGHNGTDRLIYKFYAEVEGDPENGTWSTNYYDILGNTSFPPNDPEIYNPTNNQAFYINASQNITIDLDWIGDPNYNNCYMNVSLCDENDVWLETISNETITGEQQRQTEEYIFNFSHWGYTAGAYRIHINITEVDNASSYSHNDRFIVLTELKTSTAVPSNHLEDVNIPLDYFAITVNHSYGEHFNITWGVNCTGPIFNTTYVTTGNGTYYAYNTSWVDEYDTDYSWSVCLNETGSVHWLNNTYIFGTQENTWIRKPGYINCTYGPPDFSQLQDNWWNLFDLNYCYCGPVAAADCLWWLDCKLNNNSNPDYFLPDLCGNGSKHSDNVMPFINLTAEYLNTSKQFAADDHSGTTSNNMTIGLLNLLNYTNLSDIFTLETEGYCDEGIWTELANYTNVTEHLVQCDDVIMLLGFYCWDGIGFGNRYGGHYVQVNGYNSETPGLSFSDPFFDRAEDGNLGWNSTHTHWPEPRTNGSHNWTTNVSYDYYWVNTSSVFQGGGGFEITDYTNSAENWTGQNWMNSTYEAEIPCEDPDEIKTVVEQVWYIGFDYNINISKKVWNGTAWAETYDAPVGTNVTFNISIHNLGETITDNITVWDTHYDSLQMYQTGSSWVVLPNGTRYQREPNWTSWEAGQCDYAPHGHIGWYFDGWELEPFSYCNYLYIEYNLSVNNSNYSKNQVDLYICNNSYCGTECLYDYSYTDSDYIYVGRQFNRLIECIQNLTRNSTWLISEHVNRPCKNSECLDMNWSEYETEYDRRMPYNTTGGSDLDWEWTYRYDNSDGIGLDDMNLSYTIVNESSMNRSQSILRLRCNVTDTGETDGNVHIGIIYSYHNDSNFDMALFSTNSVLLLSKNGTQLENTNDSTIVTDIGDAYDYWDEYWSCNDTYDPEYLDPIVFPEFGAQGIWVKTLWNSFVNRLQVKAWNITTDIPFALYPYEQSGWIADEFMKVTTVDVTKGGADGSDVFIPSDTAATIINVTQAGTTYELFDDYTYYGNVIDWFQADDQPVTSTVYNVNYISKENINPSSECFGLVVWKPPDASDSKFYADFDFLEAWKVNYTTDGQANATEVAQRPVFNNTGIPLMYFNAFNHSEWLDEVEKYYNNCEERYNSTLITSQEYADCVSCVYQNISKKLTMNGRSFNRPYKNCGIGGEMDNQNDTIYYHSSLVTNITNQPYQSAIAIQIDVPTDGNYDHGDGAVVMIDVDNDLNWTVNDLAFVWWDWTGIGTHYTIYTGNESWSSGFSGSTGIQARFYANWTTDVYNWSTINYMLPALHRYSGHRVYRATIPTWYFRHDDLTSFLQTNETFGLHVMTIDAGPDGVPPGVSVPVWENYNSSSDLPLISKESNGSDVWDTFLNLSTLDEIENFYFYQNWSLDLNYTEMQLWGHGRFGNESGELNTSFWDINASKEANKTIIVNVTQDVFVNYTIEICNEGDVPVHNVTFNDTLPTGVVFVSSTIDSGNYSNPYDNVWLFNVTNVINASNCTNFTIQVNFTAGCATNGSYVYNFGNASCEEGAIASCNVSVKYGENMLPVIVWEYPADTATGVSITPTGLANISVYVTDDNGDNLDIYFFTNKTNTWDSGWNAIGENLTVGNGTYLCNQTFNVSQRYNTQWRWGATKYYWYINVTDGNAWVNESKTYTTGTSRYDVTSSGDVVSEDVSWAWGNRQGQASYLGIYDVDASGDIVSGDISDIWANRT